VTIEERRSRLRFQCLFAAIFTVSSGTLIAISVLLFGLGVDQRVTIVQDVEIHAVDIRQEAVAEVLAGSVSDLLFISELNEVDAFLASPSTETRDPLAHELVVFARGHRAHSRIAILSPTGDELLRVDQTEEGPSLVPEAALVSRSETDDFRALSLTPAGSLRISVPQVKGDRSAHKEVLLGLALIGDLGEVDGYALLGLQLDAVTEAFAAAHPNEGATALLVDGDGEWLRGPEPSFEPNLPVERDRADFGSLFSAAWSEIAANSSGQLETADGLFTFDTLVLPSEVDRVRSELGGPSPGSVPSDEELLSWKNVSWVPAATMSATRRAGLGRLLVGDIAGVILLGIGAWSFTRWAKRRSDIHRRTAHEKDVLQSALGKYMPSQIRDRLLRDPARRGRLGGESQDVVVLFADIRGFTSFAERRDPEESVAVLNQAMAELIAPLRIHGGILDKYVGDGLLAFFEPSPALDGAARRAVEAAHAMQRGFRNLWANSLSEELRRLGLGIGISAGRVVVGNVGSEETMNYTVIGDPVNVASRLQDLAASGEILVSEAIHDLLQAEIDTEVMPQIRLHGRSQPLDVHRVRSVE
jgi:class 3 adenylate cyclase